MPYTVVNNTGGAQTLSQALGAFNDILKFNQQQKMDQIKLDQLATDAQLKRDQWEAEQRLARDQLTEDRRGRHDLNYRHGLDHDVNYENMLTSRRNADTSRMTEDRLTEGWERLRGIGDRYNVGMNPDLKLGMVDGEVVHPSMMDVFAGQAYQGNLGPTSSLPRQLADTENTRATAMKSRADAAETNKNLEDLEENTLKANIFLQSPFGKAFAEQHPSLADPEVLGKQWVDDKWVAYVTGAEKNFQEGKPIGHYNQFLMTQAALEGGNLPGAPDALVKYQEGMFEKASKAESRKRKIQRMMHLASDENFNAGGGQFLADAIQIMKSAYVRFGGAFGASAEDIAKVAKETKVTGTYQAEQIELLIGLAGELYPVSDKDSAMLLLGTGAIGNDPAAIREILKSRYTDADNIEASAIKFRGLMEQAAEDYANGDFNAYQRVMTGLLPNESSGVLEWRTGNKRRTRDGGVAEEFENINGEKYYRRQ